MSHCKYDHAALYLIFCSIWVQCKRVNPRISLIHTLYVQIHAHFSYSTRQLILGDDDSTHFYTAKSLQETITEHHPATDANWFTESVYLGPRVLHGAKENSSEYSSQHLPIHPNLYATLNELMLSGLVIFSISSFHGYFILPMLESNGSCIGSFVWIKDNSDHLPNDANVTVTTYLVSFNASKWCYYRSTQMSSKHAAIIQRRTYKKISCDQNDLWAIFITACDRTNPVKIGDIFLSQKSILLGYLFIQVHCRFHRFLWQRRHQSLWHCRTLTRNHHQYPEHISFVLELEKSHYFTDGMN